MSLRNGFAGHPNHGGLQSLRVHDSIFATFSIVQCGWGQTMIGDFTAGRAVHLPQQSGRQRPLLGETFVHGSTGQKCGRASNES